MKVTVEINPMMFNPSGARVKTEIELADGATASDLLLKLGYNPMQIKAIIPVINGVQKRTDAILKNGDDIWLTVAIGGG